MDTAKIILLVLYATGMAMGQLLFKLAATESARAPSLVPALAANKAFLMAVTLYALLTLLWVWLLTKVPLVYAFPFATLAYVFTPILAMLVLHERVGIGYAVGSLFLVIGLGVIAATARI